MANAEKKSRNFFFVFFVKIMFYINKINSYTHIYSINILVNVFLFLFGSLGFIMQKML